MVQSVFERCDTVIRNGHFRSQSVSLVVGMMRRCRWLDVSELSWSLEAGSHANRHTIRASRSDDPTMAPADGTPRSSDTRDIHRDFNMHVSAGPAEQESPLSGHIYASVCLRGT